MWVDPSSPLSGQISLASSGHIITALGPVIMSALSDSPERLLSRTQVDIADDTDRDLWRRAADEAVTGFSRATPFLYADYTKSPARPILGFLVN
jgi:hypothetical protein